MTPRIRNATLMLVCMTLLCGCGPSYTALTPGSAMPEINVAGWAHDRGPGELAGKVIVIEAFATW